MVNAVLCGEADEGASWPGRRPRVELAGARASCWAPRPTGTRADRGGHPAGRPARQAPGTDRRARGPPGGDRRGPQRPAGGGEVADRAVRAGAPSSPGPVVPDLLAATRSAQAAAAGLKACHRLAGRSAPGARRRPAAGARDRLGPLGREQLVEEIYRPLEEAGAALLETLSVYLEQASSPGGRRPDALRSPQHRALPAPTCD